MFAKTQGSSQTGFYVEFYFTLHIFSPDFSKTGIYKKRQFACTIQYIDPTCHYVSGIRLYSYRPWIQHRVFERTLYVPVALRNGCCVDVIERALRIFNHWANARYAHPDPDTMQIEFNVGSEDYSPCTTDLVWTASTEQ